MLARLSNSSTLVTCVVVLTWVGCDRTFDPAAEPEQVASAAGNVERITSQTPQASASQLRRPAADETAKAAKVPPTMPITDEAGKVATTSIASQPTETGAAAVPESQPANETSGHPAAPQVVLPNSARDADEPSESPAFRLWMPTTSGPLIVDVDIRIGEEPLATAFGERIAEVMARARGSSELTWSGLFRYVSNNPQQFGRRSISPQQHRNLIRLFDMNRNKRPDHGEVAKFLFRQRGFSGPFQLVGVDAFREINRSQSALLAVMDRNGDRVLDAGEIELADEALNQLDHNADQRIDPDELASPVSDAQAVWRKRGSNRWGQVAMDLSGYVDWTMLSYTLDETAGAAAFGRQAGLISKLDRDGNDSIGSDEARLLLSAEPDFRLLVQYPRVAGAGAAEISIASVSSELSRFVRCSSSEGQICIEGGSLRLVARVLDGQSAGNFITPEVFAMLDANNDGELDESEIPEVALREYSFDDLDQDGNDQLTLEEIIQGMSPKSPIWSVQVRSRGSESPDGIFAWLDTNQDNALSTREISQAVQQLKDIASPDGSVSPADIPDTFLIRFGRGDPDQDEQLFSATRVSAPDRENWPRWAESMDTNRDGDISRQEFPGTREQFAGMDSNSDGFIDLEESQQNHGSGENRPEVVK